MSAGRIRKQVETEVYVRERAGGADAATARDRARGAYQGTRREFQRIRRERDELLRLLAEEWGVSESEAWLVARLDMTDEGEA